MSENISDKFKKLQASVSSATLASDDLALLFEKLESIKLMLVNMQLKGEIKDLKETSGKPSGETSGKPSGETSGKPSGKAPISLDEKIDRLRGVTTNLTVDNVEKFLLHRPTNDFEYEGSSVGNEFKTSGDTEWFADVAEASSHMIATNPVVSVWVPKSDIKDVPHATSKEDSNWGELGTNPSQSRYKAIVKEGTYTVYQELKKTDDLRKGSLQRRHKFDPAQVNLSDRQKTEDWTEGIGERGEVPRMEGNDRFRALQRLHGLTPSRRNPKTGEREFLLHHGQTFADIRNGELGFGGKASFTPDPETAAEFAKEHICDLTSKMYGCSPIIMSHHNLEDHPVTSLLVNPQEGQTEDEIEKLNEQNRNTIKQHFGNIYSAWVPESRIHSIPNQWGTSIHEHKNTEKGVPGPQNRRDEHEVIINTRGLDYNTTKHDNIGHLQASRQKHVNAVRGVRPIPAQLRLLKKAETLAKGQNGDWQKEGGYTLVTHHLPSGGVHVRAYHPSVHWATNAVSENEQGNHTGSSFMTANDYESKYGEGLPILKDNHQMPNNLPGKGGLVGSVTADKSGQVCSSFVHPGHRRKGIASSLYSKAESDMGVKLKPDTAQSPSAMALWSQPNKPFGKSLEKAIDPNKSKSVVKDETGNLKPVYHGTLKPFSSFQNKFISKKISLNYGPGHYFTEDSSEANIYAKYYPATDPTTNPDLKSRDVAPNVHKVFLNIKNPFNIHNYHDAKKVAAAFGHDYNPDMSLANTPEHPYNEEKYNPYDVNHYHMLVNELNYHGHIKGSWQKVSSVINKKMQELGYDGIVNKGAKHWVAFNDSQVAHPHVNSTHKRMHKGERPNSEPSLKKSSRRHFKAGYKAHLGKSSLKKADDLSKGSLQRRTPTKGSVLDKKHPLWMWVNNAQKNREEIPRDSGAIRERGLQKLSGLTHTRLTPDNKREFLLHRGSSYDYKRYVDHKSDTAMFHILPDGHNRRSTSWTPDYSVAHSFGGNNVMSTWIHEDDIHALPISHKIVNSKSVRNEREVIVRPSKPLKLLDSQKALMTSLPHSSWGSVMGDEEKVMAEDGYYDTKDLRNINQKINDKVKYPQPNKPFGEPSLKKSSKVFNFFEYSKKLKDKPKAGSGELAPIFIPDPDYVEDPWTEEKYRRGGFEEAEKFKKEHIPSPDEEIPEDTDPLQKAVRKLNPKPKAASNKAVALKIADQIQNEGHHGGILRDAGVQKLTVPALYRFYKNSPHHPESLLMKYLIHRVENADQYDNASPEQALRLKQNFLALHQQGGAKEKNGHINVQKLDQMALTKPSLISGLMTHRDHLHHIIQRHFPSRIQNIAGEPHLGLTRGLHVDKDKRRTDHALASYGHVPNTGFGSYMHHQHVPLKNIWYSFDLGSKESSGNMGPENEFLASPHENKYTNDANTTRTFPKKVFLEPKDMASIVKGVPNHNMAKHSENLKYLNKVMTNSLPNSDEYSSLAQNPLITPEMQLRLVQASGSNSFIHQTLAKNQSITPEVQAHLIHTNNPDSMIYNHLARNKSLTPELQMHIAEKSHSGSEVRSYLSENENLASEVQTILAHEPSGVHSELTLNESLTPEIQMFLAQTKETGSNVHADLSRNKSLTPEVQLHLAQVNAPNHFVHWGLADNPSLTPEAQLHLIQANKPGSIVQTRLARTSHSDDVHTQLIHDNEPNSEVHDKLSENPSLSPEKQLHLAQINKPESHIHRQLAKISHSDNVHAHLAHTNPLDSWVHTGLAHNPSLSPALQLHLAHVNKPDSIVHEILATNETAPPEVQMHLAQANKPGSTIHKNLEDNKITTPEVREHIRQAKNEHMLAQHLGKSADESGNKPERYEITPEYTLTKKPWTEAGNYYGKPRDYWELHHASNPKKPAGRFLIDTENEPTMSHSKVESEHRNKGLGSAVYTKLANHYGSLSSDTTKTSRSAKRVWEKIGGIATGLNNKGRQNKQRYKVTPGTSQLGKSQNLNSIYVLMGKLQKSQKDG